MQTQSDTPAAAVATVALATAALAYDLPAVMEGLARLEALRRQYVTVNSLAEAYTTARRDLFPCWPVQPSSEQETKRNGSDTIYIYLYWPRDRYTGEYTGPTNAQGKGMRKSYIGAKKDKIFLARALTANLRRAKTLDRAIQQISWEITGIGRNAASMEERARLLRLKAVEAVNAETEAHA